MFLKKQNKSSRLRETKVIVFFPKNANFREWYVFLNFFHEFLEIPWGGREVRKVMLICGQSQKCPFSETDSLETLFFGEKYVFFEKTKKTFRPQTRTFFLFFQKHFFSFFSNFFFMDTFFVFRTPFLKTKNKMFLPLNENLFFPKKIPQKNVFEK